MSSAKKTRKRHQHPAILILNASHEVAFPSLTCNVLEQATFLHGGMLIQGIQGIWHFSFPVDSRKCC
jgi:hypothetical protein